MTKKKARRHNEPWSVNEVRWLRGYARGRMSARQAAQKLGRSVGATKYKAMAEEIHFTFIRQPRGVQQRLARRRRVHGMRATLRAARR